VNTVQVKASRVSSYKLIGDFSRFCALANNFYLQRVQRAMQIIATARRRHCEYYAMSENASIDHAVISVEHNTRDFWVQYITELVCDEALLLHMTVLLPLEN